MSSRIHVNLATHEGRGWADALLRGEVTITVTIHDRMSALWQKGAGSEQLREGV